jgi:hypothetical protein
MQVAQRARPLPTVSRLTDRLKPTAGHVRCVDCGFFNQMELTSVWDQFQQTGTTPGPDEGPGGKELFLTDREKIRFRRFRNVGSLNCYRHLPFYDASADDPLRRDELDKRIYDGALASRICDWYESYAPGLPPADHMLIQLQPPPQPVAEASVTTRWGLTALACTVTFFLGLVLRPGIEALFTPR